MISGKLCVLAALVGLGATECRATEYIMTATGTISSGSQVSKYFGNGSSLIGDAVTYSMIYSAGSPDDVSYINYNTGDAAAAYVSQLSPKFIVTIGGVTLTFDNGGVDNGSSAQVNLHKGHSLPVPYGNADSMYMGGYYNGAASTFAEGDISAYAFWSPFLQSYDLNVPETDIVQCLDAAIPGQNAAFFEYSSPGTVDGLQVQFTMNLSEVTLASYTDPTPPSAVPEPSSLVMLGGLLGLISFRARRNHFGS